MGNDIWYVIEWWSILFVFGASGYPLAKYLYSIASLNIGKSKNVLHQLESNKNLSIPWWDGGYVFAKAIGLAVTTLFVYALCSLKISAFNNFLIIFSLVFTFLIGIVCQIFCSGKFTRKNTWIFKKNILIKILLLELFFFLLLLFWSYIKGFEPQIRGLEKFMDYGFVRSILTSGEFPVWDMWYAGKSLNYYYFGHITLAILTKLSGIDLSISFNLMLSTIFALCASMSYSIGHQLILQKIETNKVTKNNESVNKYNYRFFPYIGGMLSSFLVTLAGNMQTIYAFTKGYTGENVKPFWELFWPINEFINNLPLGIEKYWYANATRFIPYTIHEFPGYSFVVSDIHGHVLSIPFALLIISLALRYFFVGLNSPMSKGKTNSFLNISRTGFIFYGVINGILLMTNALDGPIYFGLFLLFNFIIIFPKLNITWDSLKDFIVEGVLMGVIVAITTLPFTYFFNSFVSGIGINCPPEFLANQRYGPILFEGVEKCQKSPLWMWWLLWGFFIYCGVMMIFQIINSNWIFRNRKTKVQILKNNITQYEKVLSVFFIFSIFLVIVPEFIYFKDIYPQHFRSNTMFKLGYQAYIMFSFISGYAIVSSLFEKPWGIYKKVFMLFIIPQLFLVSFYPIRSIPSYFGNLKTYQGLYGLAWLDNQFAENSAVIRWLTSKSYCNVINCENPVIVEADGDSYTDYNQISAFAGMPSVIGWGVHEWLWRGTYDVVSPRREDVRLIYESVEIGNLISLLKKYSVQLIIVGKQEREKYKNININNINQVSIPIYKIGSTTVYKISIDNAHN